MKNYPNTGLKISFICSFILFVFSSLSFAPHTDLKQSVAGSNEKHEVVNSGNSFVDAKRFVYDSLNLQNEGLSREAFELGLMGMQKLLETGKTINPGVLTIADFSQPSSNRRLYVIDLNDFQLSFHTLVAHGRNSGRETADIFSNKISSNKSSLGFYVTGNTYTGSHGYSLKLTGVEEGVNDNANSRAIVVHAANYVHETLAKLRGYIGRSQGCPAIPVSVHRPLINKIKDGTCLFIYHPSSQYIDNSPLLNS